MEKKAALVLHGRQMTSAERPREHGLVVGQWQLANERKQSSVKGVLRDWLSTAGAPRLDCPEANDRQ